MTLVFVVVVVLVSIVSMVCASESRRMNVIVIIADDLGFADTSFNYRLHHREGSDPPPPIPTPYIDSLADRGIILNNMYVHPHCAASRTALLTSRYNIRLGDPFPLAGAAGLDPKFKTLADEFKQRGYDTFHVGKWGVDGDSDMYRPGRGGPIERGFDRFFGVINSAHDHFEKYVISPKRVDLHEYDRTTKSYKDFPDVSREPTVHSSDLFARKAMEYISEHVNRTSSSGASHERRPFFMQLSFTAPHDPLQAYPADEAKPACAKINGGWRRRTYCAMVLGVDLNVGRLAAHLRKLDIAKDTIIYFMSDNGGHYLVGASNAPLRGAKATGWEGGVRVPSFFYTPDVFGSPRVLKGLTHVTDIGVTLLKVVDTLAAVEVSPDGSAVDDDDDDDDGDDNGSDDGGGEVDEATGLRKKMMRLMKVKQYPSLLGKVDGIDFSQALLGSSRATMTEHRSEMFVGGSIFANASTYIMLPYKLCIGRIGDSRRIAEPTSGWSVNNPTLMDMMEEMIVDGIISTLGKNFFPFEWAMHFLFEHLRDVVASYRDSKYQRKAQIDVPVFFPLHDFDRSEASGPIPWPGVSIAANTPVYLYNIEKDPYETTNLAARRPDLVEEILSRMQAALADSEPQQKAIPVFFGWMMMVECYLLLAAAFIFFLASVFIFYSCFRSVRASMSTATSSAPAISPSTSTPPTSTSTSASTSSVRTPSSSSPSSSSAKKRK